MSDRPEWVPAEIADEDLHWWLGTLEANMTEINYHWRQLADVLLPEEFLYRCNVAAPYLMLILVVMVVLR